MDFLRHRKRYPTKLTLDVHTAWNATGVSCLCLKLSQVKDPGRMPWDPG